MVWRPLFCQSATRKRIDDSYVVTICILFVYYTRIISKNEINKKQIIFMEIIIELYFHFYCYYFYFVCKHKYTVQVYNHFVSQ